MKDKELIIESIDVYDTYNQKTKMVLKALVAEGLDTNITNISIKNLSSLSGVSRQGVYNALRRIEGDNIVTRSKTSGKGTSTFSFNLEKIKDIINYKRHLDNSKNLIQK